MISVADCGFRSLHALGAPRRMEDCSEKEAEGFGAQLPHFWSGLSFAYIGSGNVSLRPKTGLLPLPICFRDVCEVAKSESVP